MTARVVLIGAPGSGKTTVGRRLGACLGVPHVDVDARIEQQQDRLIREIFADDGEAHFRELERDATLVALSEDAVLSLGGGAVMTPAIRDALAGHRVVWLKVSVHDAVKRVGLDEARPLLMGNLRSTLIRLLRARTPVYEATAGLAVDTDGLTPDEVADVITTWLEEQS